MSEPFIGEIQLFGFDFAPYQWASCAGQLLPIQQNTALFSLLGTAYGGDGKTTFALPNLQGQAACATGQGPGLSPRTVGESFGSDAVTLLQGEMPAHTHVTQVYNQRDENKRHGSPVPGDALIIPPQTSAFTTSSTPSGSFTPQTLGPSGGGQPHENRQPYLALNFCIALQGMFPQRP